MLPHFFRAWPSQNPGAGGAQGAGCAGQWGGGSTKTASAGQDFAAPDRLVSLPPSPPLPA